MDVDAVLNFLYEFAVTLSIFGIGLGWAFFVGRQSLINVLVSSYIALVFFSDFPFKDTLLNLSGSALVKAFVLIGLFLLFVCVINFVIKKVMPLEFYEGKFENVGKKIVLASGVTIFYTGLCFTVVPVHEILSLDTPIQTLLAHGNLFYYSLILPLGTLAMQ